jgi:hypothetical protein
MMTTYLGSRSLAVAPFAARGLHVPCSKTAAPGRLVDAWGLELGLATLPGGTDTVLHDACEGELFRIMTESGVRLDIQPSHIFATAVAVPAALDPVYGRPPAIVPDAAAAVSLPPVTPRNQRQGRPLPERVLLFDVKTIHGGGGIYFTAWARDGQSGAVAQRAWDVDGEYRGHARKLDLDVNGGGTAVRDRLQSFGRVRGLVFGQYGEWSEDVDSLLELAATASARRDWRMRGNRTMEESRGIYIALFRRRLGCFVVREFARHRLRRLPFVGLTRDQVRARRRRRDTPVQGRDEAAGVRAADYYAYGHAVAPAR